LLLAACHINQRSPDAVWCSVHSDAFITDDAEFRRTLSAALQAASTGEYLMTTGIRPRGPETGYGYIQLGQRLGTVDGYPFHRVARFVEKPDLPTAQAYVASGDYLWNPGVFVWRNGALLSAFERLLPDIYGVLTSVPVERVDEVYAGARRETIDVGIMERAPNVATIPADFGWSDIGSWAELWELAERDANGNAFRGRVLVAESQGNLVFAEGRTVALVGVEDLVVVETADAVFVCPRERAQDVKLIVQRLQKEGDSALL
jgi:mannose-1-phosphate guanylyltransferase